MPLRLLLADDHQVFREGLKALLDSRGFLVAGQASDGHQAVRLARTQHPDVAVLDIGMPGLNGLEAARQVRRDSPRTKVIVLTMHTEDAYVLAALRAGISGYVLKTQASADLIQAIDEVSKGALYLSPGISRAVVEAYLAGRELPSDPLSPREREVLQMVAEGKTTKEIAYSLAISVKTAEAHRGAIMRKLDLHDTASLVRYAIRRGLTQA